MTQDEIYGMIHGGYDNLCDKQGTILGEMQAVEQMLDYVKRIGDLAHEKHPEFNPFNKGLCELLLAGPKGYVSIDKTINRSCVEYDASESTILDYFAGVISEYEELINSKIEEHDKTPPKVGYIDIELRDALNKLATSYATKFDASVVYREYILGESEATKLSGMLDPNTVRLIAEKSVTSETNFALSSPGGIADKFAFGSTAELMKWITRYYGQPELMEKYRTFNTNVLIREINLNSNIPVDEVYKIFRDEIVGWVKTHFDKRSDDLIKTMLCIDFDKFCLFSYRYLLNAGDADSVIKDYNSSITDTSSDQVKADVSKSVETIRKMKYYIHSMFMELTANERLPNRFLSANTIAFILSTEPNMRSTAFQVCEVFTALYSKSEFVTERINSYYIHFIPHDEADSRDVFLASVLAAIYGFNVSSQKIFAPSVFSEFFELQRTIIGISIQRFIRGMKAQLSFVEKHLSGKLTYELKTKIDSAKFTLSYPTFEEVKNKIKVLKEVIGSIVDDFTNSKNEDSTSEHKAYAEFYKDKIRQLDGYAEYCEYAIDRFASVSKETEILYHNIKNFNVVNYNDVIGNIRIADFEDWGYYGKIIWPRRVIEYIEQIDPSEREDIAKIPYEERSFVDTTKKMLEDLKPGDIFKRNNPEMTVKSGCK